MTIHEDLAKYVADADDPMEAVQELRRVLFDLSPLKAMPIDLVRWVPVEKVEANDYNPNSVAKHEMRLLFISIDHDGYTQPVVTVYDEDRDKYVIVDGFHRFFTLKSSTVLMERTGGRLPIVVLDKGIKDRMASTVRHNRARGEHSIKGMSSMVFALLEEGWSDAEVCNELGLEPEELIRLKHITGFSKLFADVEYRKAWVTNRQIRFARDAEAELV